MTAASMIRGPHAPPEPADVELLAGPLRALLRGGDLVHVGFGSLDVVRQVYCAVRDEQWGTILPAISGLQVRGDSGSFSVAFDASHVTSELDFRCHGRIEGTADGTVSYELDGVAGRAFPYSRIGLCVLLAVPPYQGRPFRATRRGTISSGRLPVEIARQPFRDALYWPAIAPFDEIEIDLQPDTRVRLAFEGDEFELEDQRNWTDATFKIYSTPLELGGPHRAEAGTRIRQRATISVLTRTPPRPRPARRPAPVEVVLGEPARTRFPPVGAIWPRGEGLTDGAALLAGLAHARLDVDLVASRDVTPPATAIPDGTAVELAVWADPPSLDRLPRAVRQVEQLTPVDRVIVVSADADVADPALIAGARERLRADGSSVPVGGGSDYWFAEVHRSPDDFRDVDFVTFSITPQLHVFDDESIFDSLPFQAEAVDAARGRVGSGQVVVSPVTIAPRDSARVRAGIAGPTDARQPSLLAAAWTAASIGVLAEAGAAAVTYFDAFGDGGLMPAAPAACGEADWAARVFPVHHVIAAACENAGRPVVGARSSDARRVDASAVQLDAGVRVTLANCTPAPQRAVVRGLPTDARPRLRRLDESTVLEAIADPAVACKRWTAATVEGGATEIGLPPYAVAWLDITGT